MTDLLTANTFLPALPSPQDRRAWGRSLRRKRPRRDQADWEPPRGRPDPVEVLVESNRTRAQDLVPIRYSRMLASPFAFLRGSALIMALDLATTPPAGIEVQLCGDSHLANFGLFASPERRLLFDLNDFDETWPGPFEWDVKRLATSAVVAARTAKMTRAQARAAALSGVRAYREWIDRYADMNHLDVWYARLDADTLTSLLPRQGRHVIDQAIDKARDKNHHRAIAKLTTMHHGVRRIVNEPPLISREDNPVVRNQLPEMVEQYRQTLPHDRRALFDHYRLVDFARKVVGVGSVGTLCWVLLMQGPNNGPLFLQAKQAGPAAPQLAGVPGDTELHEGERIVRGQQRLQAASDILLGWATAPESGNAYYIRQLWDSKGSAEIESMSPTVLARYTGACGWALARAHARTGGSCSIAGYLGRSARFDAAVADFAEAYADQTVRDHARLAKAASTGLIKVARPGA